MIHSHVSMIKSEQHTIKKERLTGASNALFSVVSS